MNTELKEIDLLISALGYCTDEKRYDQLQSIIKTCLATFIETRDGEALWQKCRLGNLGEERELSDEELDEIYAKLIEEAAHKGSSEALYVYANDLYDKDKKPEATQYYLKAANLGNREAQWCVGLGLLNGVGIEKDISEGLFYIDLSASQLYDSAVEFMLDATREEKYGLSRDASRKWEFLQHQLDK